eukprot:gene8465-7743_t
MVTDKQLTSSIKPGLRKSITQFSIAAPAKADLEHEECAPTTGTNSECKDSQEEQEWCPLPLAPPSPYKRSPDMATSDDEDEEEDSNIPGDDGPCSTSDREDDGTGDADSSSESDSDVTVGYTDGRPSPIPKRNAAASREKSSRPSVHDDYDSSGSQQVIRAKRFRGDCGMAQPEACTTSQPVSSKPFRSSFASTGGTATFSAARAAAALGASLAPPPPCSEWWGE